MKFSLVYPTRDRPQFIANAIKFLERQNYTDFEVIVVDNCSQESLSCERVCTESTLGNVKYIRAPRDLGMVENWNYAAEFPVGDYTCFFTDKMFILPDTLDRVGKIIEAASPDLVSWVDNVYAPKTFPDYFGEGYYCVRSSSVANGDLYAEFDPKEELSKKGRLSVSRKEQTPSHYARGKICFGCYSGDLIDRIKRKSGNLFHNISPDYTSMILALSMCDKAVEMERAGVVHINTDLSNGGMSDRDDEAARKFLEKLAGYPELLEKLLVPGAYSSLLNWVAHDYVTRKAENELAFEFDKLNWLAQIQRDIFKSERTWSSREIEENQKGLFEEHIRTSLSEGERNEYIRRVSVIRLKNKRSPGRILASYFRKVIKYLSVRLRFRIPGDGMIRKHDSIIDIINDY